MSVHATAIVDPRAELDPDVEVGPHCVIDGDVRVAAGCRLYPGVYLTGHTEIAEGCALHPGVIVGHHPQDTKYGGEPVRCRVGERTILREHATVHGGTGAKGTVIGADCFILAGAHVAHDCVLGDFVTLINNVLLAGHVHIDDRATLGGGAAVHQFVRVGELAMIGGLARITMDVPPFALIDGTGRVAGVNRIGMRRAEVPPAEIRAVREAYRTLYGCGLPFRAAVDRLAGEDPHSTAVARLLRFVRAESRRGVVGRSRGDADSSTSTE